MELALVFLNKAKTFRVDISKKVYSRILLLSGISSAALVIILGAVKQSDINLPFFVWVIMVPFILTTAVISIFLANTKSLMVQLREKYFLLKILLIALSACLVFYHLFFLAGLLMGLVEGKGFKIEMFLWQYFIVIGAVCNVLFLYHLAEPKKI